MPWIDAPGPTPLELPKWFINATIIVVMAVASVVGCQTMQPTARADDLRMRRLEERVTMLETEVALLQATPSDSQDITAPIDTRCGLGSDCTNTIPVAGKQ